MRVARAARAAFAGGALLVLGALVPDFAAQRARPAVLDLGPNDFGYVAGFREGWERDGHVRFRWTTLQSTVRLPLRLEGAGARLRLRMRRHFVDPARLTLIVEGRTAALLTVAADPRVPYREYEVPLPPQDGRHPFTLTVQAAVDNQRPLGVAIDWLQLERGEEGARFHLDRPTRAYGVLVALATAGAVLLVGASIPLALAYGAGAVVLTAAAFLAAPLAAERFLREGAASFVATASLVALLLRVPTPRRWLGVSTRRAAVALTALALAALAVRLGIVLHPLHFYPDVHVHALFARALVREGLAGFLADFTANQFRHSLGLQFENGHWYAFPYPPGFYVATWPLTRLLGWRPEIAVGSVASVANAMEVLLVYAIGRRLSERPAVALAAAAAVPLLPLFTIRLALAYFPALLGHALDALLLLVLLDRLDRLRQPRTILLVALLLALALLTYTQSLLNFGILLPLYLVLCLARARDAAERRRLSGLVAASVLGVALALGLFYARYVPILADMQRGIPMPEEQILLDIFAKREAIAPSPPDAAEAQDDPFAGPGVAPLRGLAKAAWRLWIFYGPFAVAVLLGLVLVARAAPALARPLLLAWALTYLLLNLASGGLPGPNLFRYNKDLESVAPLALLALGAAGVWLWERSRVLAVVFAVGFLAWSVRRLDAMLATTFDFVR